MRDRKFFYTMITLVVMLSLVITSEAAFTLKRVMESDVESAAKNLTGNVYSTLEEDITRPIAMSQIMAGNTFLKQWLKDYAKGSIDETQLVGYLKNIQETISADTVFVVSEATGNYYTNNGFNKTISKEDAHDVWYYIFKESGLSYDLDVDVDEVHDKRWTIFINTRIEDENGNLLGVGGIGVRMDEVQKAFIKYEKENNVKINLVNAEGVVQVDANSEYIENADLSVVIKDASINDYVYKVDEKDGFVVTQYIEHLGWYLVIRSERSATEKAFWQMLFKEGIVIAVDVGLLLFGLVFFYRIEQRESIDAETTDALTKVKNRGYIEYLKQKNQLESFKTIAMMDIDDFKQINDKKGHIAGDEILKKVAEVATIVCGSKGEVIRWGGDEMLMLFSSDEVETMKCCKVLQEKVSAYGISLSIGIANIVSIDGFDDAIKAADRVLYKVKEAGKNNIKIY